MQAPNWTDFLSCSVCMSKYNCHSVVPVSLSCCHTICKRCLSRLKTNTCPYDRTPIPHSMLSYPPNTALLFLLGFESSDWIHEVSNLSPAVMSDADTPSYTKARESMENLAMFLKPFIEQGVLQATASIPRPVLKKLVMLLNCQILDIEGRGKALRAAHSIAERIITELLIMHQNPQQIPALLWTAVRNRGCQFLGPIMQEEALRLILKVLETGPHLSRKNIVLYVVQQLQSDFPNASKTNIGHVVQLLYRASCFNVEKREDESSLMQLKEEYRTYDSLRREHDAQIIKIAMEAGLRITPETWSTQLYGNTSRKSEMQSIIDKLVSQGVASSGLSELIVAVGRSQDPQGLSEKLVPHLDALLKIVQPTERILDDPPVPQDPMNVASVYAFAGWTPFSIGIDELLLSLQAFTDFSQIHYKDRSEVHTQVPHGKYKTGICPYLTKPGGCPRGQLCPYAHSEEEKRKYINIVKTTRRPPPSAGLMSSGSVSGVGKPSSTQPASLSPLSRPSVGLTRTSSHPPPLRQTSDDLSNSPYSSLEESNGYGSFPGGTVVYPHTGTTFILPSSIPPMIGIGGGGGTPGGGGSGTTHGSFHPNSSSLDSYSVLQHQPPPPPPTVNSYTGYDPMRGYDSSRGVATYDTPRSEPSYDPSKRVSMESYSKVDNVPPVSSQYSTGKTKPTESQTTPTSLPMPPSGEAWTYGKQSVGSTTQSSMDRVSSPAANTTPVTNTTTGIESSEGDSTDEYNRLPAAMKNVKLTEGGGHKKDYKPNTVSSSDESSGGIPNPGQSPEQKMVNELHARIQHLEAELEESRRLPDHPVPPPPHPPMVDGHGNIPPPPPHYQPNYYHTSPHHSGEIMRGPNFSGPLPPQQYPQTQPASLPVDTGYYHPLYGLPGHIPGHPWSGQLMVSPHTTPPNTQLLLTAPAQAPPPPLAPNPIQQPHPSMMSQHDHYSQIENDAMIAHFIQFAEQSKAQGFHIAPGAPPTPMVHHGPNGPQFQGLAGVRPPPSQIIAGKHYFK